nr:hypothetical protein [Tanacetum cinerariifolium]
MMNSEELMEDQKQLQDEPSARRSRLFVNKESNQTNRARYIQIQDGNHYSGVDLPMVTHVRLYEPMEWTEDDLSKEIVENLDEENMSPRSSMDVLQEAKNYYQTTEEPEVMLQSFRAQLTEWTQDDLDKELMETLDEDNLSPRSSTNVIQQAYNLWQDTEVTLDCFLNQPGEWTQDDLFKEIMEKVEEDNLSPRSLSKDHHQEFQDYFQDTKQPQVALEGFSHQLVEWSEDDFKREIMEPLESL